MKVKWVLVVFHKGKRIEKVVDDPKATLPKVKQLRAGGAKAHLVSFGHPTWPPEDDDMSKAGDGMLWCPYCRTWRWFAVPRYRQDAEFMGPEWFMNVFSMQEIRVCQWCWVSEQDWYVKTMNGLWGQENRRRKKRSRRRRSRV